VTVQGAKRWRIARAAIVRAAGLALAKAAPQVMGEVTVVLTDDAHICALNGTYRHKQRATDVLAFPLGSGERADDPLGDVVVSIETARRQARDYGATLEHEVQRLVVHGTLHLCGYDHHERREAARMHGLTRRILRELRKRGGR
jgi:probable rRNA maturation factor